MNRLGLKYTALIQGDSDESLLAPSELDSKEPLLSSSDVPAARTPFRRSSLIPVGCALALLLANVLVLAFATSRFTAIFHRLKDAVDVVDTRALPRPDPLYKLVR